MSAQLFLIAPPNPDLDACTATIQLALAQAEVAALLLQRGTLAERAYKDLVKAIVPHAQAAGAAVIIEGEPGWVRLLGADGLHVTGALEDVREAVAALKPDQIVGVGAVDGRHDAMTKGELEIDYILFGPLSGAIAAGEREMARWWAETMEIPSVLSDPEANADNFADEGCEFIGLGVQMLEPAR